MSIKYVSDLLQLPIENFIEQSYLKILNRPADEDGKAHYLMLLLTGTSKSEIIFQLAKSKEAKNIRTNLYGLNNFLRRKEKLHHWFWSFWNKPNYQEIQTTRVVHQLEDVSRLLLKIQTKFSADDEIRAEGNQKTRGSAAGAAHTSLAAISIRQNIEKFNQLPSQARFLLYMIAEK